jgi:inner membrane protein
VGVVNPHHSTEEVVNPHQASKMLLGRHALAAEAVHRPAMAGFGHVAVGVVSGRLHGTWSGRKLLLGLLVFAFLGMLPDFDVILVALGADDRGLLGHRGVSHTPMFALAAGLLAALITWARGQRRPIGRGLVVALVVCSHCILDALTQDGRGMMFLWPLSADRFHFPWRPIPDAPRGWQFFSAIGLRHFVIELIYFAPFTLYAVWPRWVRRSLLPRLVAWAERLVAWADPA